MAIWQASTAGAMLAQIVLITHAFGIGGYGRFAVVVAFVDLVGGCLNLRVGYASTTFGARWLARDARVAAGVFQFGFVIDLATAAAATVLVAALAFVVGSDVAGGGSGELMAIYGLALLGPGLSRTSFVILRLLDRFALIAAYQWLLELGRIVLLVAAIALFDSLLSVVVAVVVAALGAGVANLVVAARIYRRVHGLSLARPQLQALDRNERRAMLRMMAHTLIISYSRVAQTQLPTVLLGAIAGTTQAGLYKVGMAAGATVGQLIGPASNALLPRLSRLWAADALGELRTLVFRASVISAAAMGTMFAAVVVFADPILRFLGGGPAGEAASTVLVLGAATQALYGLVFWHSTLLFAAGRTAPMSVVSVAAAVVHVLAMLVLVPPLGADGAAIALLISQALVNVALTTLALRTLRAGIDAANDCAGRPARIS